MKNKLKIEYMRNVTKFTESSKKTYIYIIIKINDYISHITG